MWLLCITKFKTVEGYRAIHLGILEENRLLFLVYLILEFLTQTNGFAFLAESRITEISSASWNIYWIEEKKKKSSFLPNVQPWKNTLTFTCLQILNRKLKDYNAIIKARRFILIKCMLGNKKMTKASCGPVSM